MRTAEKDEEVRGDIRAWLFEQGDRPDLDLGALEARLLLAWHGYTVADFRALYGPLVAELRAPKAVFKPVETERMGGARPPARHVQPVVATDNLSRLSAIDQDIARMRAYALVADPAAPGGLRIKFPAIYERAVHQAMRALEINLKIGQSLYDLDRVRTYVTRLGDIVHKHVSTLPPEVMEAILAEIDELNHDFTAPARLGDDGAS